MSNLDPFSRLSSIGNLRTYTKNLTMTKQWKQRKESGQMVVRYNEDNYITEAGKNMARKKQADYQLLTEMQEEQKNTDTRLQEIHDKLAYGASLNDDELEYLKDKDPQLYTKLKAEQAQNEAFAKKLSQAKTKDEAKQIMIERENAALMKVKSVENNPHISIADKLTIYQEANRSVNQGQEIFRRFVASGAYDRLPTEEEKLEVEAEKKKAEESELLRDKKEGNTTDPAENQVAEESKVSDPTEKQDAGEKKVSDSSKSQAKREGNLPSQPLSENQSNEAADSKSVDAVEGTEKARKVKRAEHGTGNTAFLHSDSSSHISAGIRLTTSPSDRDLKGIERSIDLHA
ncbi:MAG: hypothetical protein PUF56_01235 [Lachnospiraceae bacterium]|nr:hypothetical protein [Lachnospiraceae bacterium]